MQKSDGLAKYVGGLIAEVIGWAFCMAVLAGAYLIGFNVAQHFGGAEHRDAFGLLSSIVVIWLYEHRRADQRWERLRDWQSSTMPGDLIRNCLDIEECAPAKAGASGGQARRWAMGSCLRRNTNYSNKMA